MRRSILPAVAALCTACASTEQPVQSAKADEEMVCTRRAPTGSQIHETICIPKSEADRKGREHREDLKRIGTPARK